MLRRFLPSWRVAFALASGVIILVACIQLNLGTGLAVLLGVIAAAMTFSLIARREPAPAARAPRRRPTRARPLAVRTGHEVMAVRDLGGGAFGGDFIPAGTRGTVTGTGWGNSVDVTWHVVGVFGGHVSRTKVQTDDVRRI